MRDVATMSKDHAPMRDLHAMLRLCLLVSPALPVGAYAYSQGLEYAVQVGWVADESSAFDWLQGMAHHSVGTLDLPILLRLYRAWQSDDAAAVSFWNAQLIASRGTAEMRGEELHLGRALARVLASLDIVTPDGWPDAAPAFSTMFSLAAVRWHIPESEMLCGYLWSWSENQVLAAIKLVPLGQSAGQRLLHRLIESMPDIASDATVLLDRHIGSGVVLQTIASALHESQYTRLFRS
jgi:urease accessory protein